MTNYERQIEEQKLKISASYGMTTDITNSALIKSEEDELQKSRGSDPVGTKKLMGGRMYIKAHDGTWKYYGQGTGRTARNHAVQASLATTGASEEAQQAFGNTITQLGDTALRSYLLNHGNPEWGKILVRAELSARRSAVAADHDLTPAPNLVASNHIASGPELVIARANARNFTTSQLEVMRDNDTSPQWIKGVVREELQRRDALQAWTDNYNNPDTSPVDRERAGRWIEHYGGTTPTPTENVVEPVVETPNQSITPRVNFEDLDEDMQNMIAHMTYRLNSDGSINDNELAEFELDSDPNGVERAATLKNFYATHDVMFSFDTGEDGENDLSAWIDAVEEEGYETYELGNGVVAVRPKEVPAEVLHTPAHDFMQQAAMPVTFDHRDIADGIQQFNNCLESAGGYSYDAGGFTAISHEQIDQDNPFDDPHALIIDTDDMSALEIADAYDKVFDRLGYTVVEGPDNGSDTFMFDVLPKDQALIGEDVQKSFNKSQSNKILSIYK